jgi:phage tail-like protein
MTRGLPPLLRASDFRVLIGRREFGFATVGPLASVTEPQQEPSGRSESFENVVLRRALTGSTDLYDWRRKIAAGKNDRRPVTIYQLDRAGGGTVNAWRLEDAWPCRWSGPSFDAASDEIAVEEIELAYRDLVWLPAEAANPGTEKKGA